MEGRGPIKRNSNNARGLFLLGMLDDVADFAIKDEAQCVDGGRVYGLPVLHAVDRAG